MVNSCMEDCVHLKACRRLQKIGKHDGVQIARHCDEDCTAYEKSLPEGVKPIRHYEIDVYGGDDITECPLCGGRLDTWCEIWLGEMINNRPPAFCPSCGVKLDWGDEDTYWNAGPYTNY